MEWVDIDVYVKVIFDCFIYFFGKGMVFVINIFDLDVIVLGGGLGNIFDLYIKGVELVKKYVFNYWFDI